jgi:flagellin
MGAAHFNGREAKVYFKEEYFMRINNNLMAMNTHRQLGINAGNGAKSIEKLSSGYRINRAGDDAAGLAISEKMRAQVRGLNQASRNSQDAISMIQTAEGALNETQAILQRMRELAVQSANDTNVDTDRSALQNEINQLSEEITRISSTTEFNTQSLLDGSLDDIKFQIGANETQELSLDIGDMSASALDVIDDTVALTSNGDSIEGIEADDDFDVSDISMVAVESGAVAATVESSGVSVAQYAADISPLFADGITNANDVSFAGSGKIMIDAAGDIPWDDLLTSGAVNDTMNISGITSGAIEYVKVDIDVVDSSGNTYAVTDYIQANASGDFVYDNHGVSFTLEADEFNKLASGAVKVDLSAYTGSGTGVDFAAGEIDVLSNYTQTYSGDKAVFGTISLDASTDDWLDDVAQVMVQGADMHTSGGGQSITVSILDSNGDAISEDVYHLSGAAFGSGNFVYDEHGVSFTIDVENAQTLSGKFDVTVIDEAVTLANASGNDDITFDITDASGNSQSIGVSLGDYTDAISLSGVVYEINVASSGAGAGAVAALDDTTNKITLTAANTGTASQIDITDTGALGAAFTVATTSGTDESIKLTFTDSEGNDTSKTIATNAGTVSFADTDGNEVTFELQEYTDLTGVNVASEFAVGGAERTQDGIDISSQESASEAITKINDAINSVSDERAKLGAVQNRLEHTIKNLDTSAENLQASESRIRDVDMAKEMMEFTKNNILQQAAQAMLAQANQAPQGVLQLLR